MSKRRVAYVSGSRADFGLMARTLQLLHRSEAVEPGILVTGMHLSKKYGLTVADIEASGLPIRARVPTSVDESSGPAMASAVGEAIVGIAAELARWRPDLVLLLGDRGEMLAGAVAALHVGIPVAHACGGERTGTIDEPMRHAISKLSHYHFVATEGARERLVRMGEHGQRIFVTGAPGVDGLESFRPEARETLCQDFSIDPARPVCLMLFHPVVQEESMAGEHARRILEAVVTLGSQALVLMPNADAGGDAIRAAIQRYASHPDVRVATHLARGKFLSWMAQADAMVGNSSSGIVESASLGAWVVNVGSRQEGREQSGNVIDVPPEQEVVRRAIADVLRRPRQRWRNVYGDGRAAERIAKFVSELPLERALLFKVNSY